MEQKEKKSNNKLPRNDTTHGTLLLCVGGYTVYMAYQMVQNTLSGASTMSMTTTAVLAGLMGLAGAAVIGLGAYHIYRDYKKK